MSLTMAELLAKARAPLDYAERHAAVFGPLIEKLQDAGILDAYFCESDMTINVTGTPDTLRAVWGTLLRAGLKAPLYRPKVGQANYSGWFRGKHDLDCAVYLIFGSTTCKRVKIGTETVTRDVYETVCEDLVVPEEPEAA